MFKHWKLVVVAASLLVGGTAFAQPTTDKPQHGQRAMRGARRIAKFDLNKDGKLDATEREAMKKEKFAKLDTNHDGVLSFDEAKPLFKHKGFHRGGRGRGRGNAGNKQQ